MKIEIFKGNWTLDDVENNLDKIFVFGDNNARIGKGGQAIIRNLPNTIGIRTKKGPSKKPAAFYKDSEFELNSKNILEDILEIKKEALDGSTIVFSDGGYGTGLASLKKKAPKTFEYLCLQLKEHFNFNNENGKKWHKIPGHNDITNGIYINLDKDNKDILQPINNSFFKPELLKSGLNTIYDLIKTENKVAFTSSKEYKNNDVLIFTFSGNDYLVCRVVDSFEISLVMNDYKWYSFEGFDKSFSIAGPEAVLNTTQDGYKYQTHFQFICVLDDKGNMVFKNDIFGGEDRPSVDIENIDKKKVKVVGDPITEEKKIKDMSVSNEEILEVLKRIESKMNKKMFNNPFKRKTIEELLKKKGLLGTVSKVESPLSNNKYLLESADGVFYYLNFNKGFLFNSVEIILTSDKKI